MAIYPVISQAFEAGDTVTCQASTTASASVVNAENISESSEFEGTNVTDTNLADSSSVLLGFTGTERELTVASAGDISRITGGENGLYVYEQHLKIPAGDIADLLSDYQTAGLSPVEKETFDNLWNRVVEGYESVLKNVDGQHIDPGVASAALRASLIQDILDDIPPMTSADDKVRVSANTDPFAKEKTLAFMGELMKVSSKNREIAKETAEQVAALTASAPGSFTQIVSRPDMYGNYTYQGNVLKLRLWNQKTTDQTYYEIDIPCTPENSERIQAMLSSEKVNNSHTFPTHYKEMFANLKKIMPEYDFSEAEAAFEKANLDNGTYSSTYISAEAECPDTIGLVNQSANAYSIVPGESFFFYCLGLEPPVYDYVDRTIILYGTPSIQMNEYGEIVPKDGGTLLPQTATKTEYVRVGGSDIPPDEVADMFIEQYLTGRYEVLTEAELIKLYPSVAYTPNREVYDIPEIYTGNIGSVARWFKGDLEAENLITHSKESIIHASADDYDYVCFCAGTNGWVRIGTGSDSRFVRYSDLCAAGNRAMEENMGVKDVIKDSYMSCSGEVNDQGHELITVIDTQAIAKQHFIHLTTADLQRIMGDHEITIGDLLDMYDDPDFQPDILFDPDEWTEEANEWWDDVIRRIKENITTGKDPFSDLIGDDPDTPDSFADYDPLHPSDTFDFDLQDFIRYLIEQGSISADDVPSTPDAITQIITEYLPDYLNTFSGRVVMDVTRIITKQLKNTTSRETSSVVNKGYGSSTHHWTISVNGVPKSNTRMSDTIQYTLAEGTNQINAYENLQNIYEDVLTYDYTEEWVLKETGQVIYKKQVNGSLNGVDGAQRDQNTIHFNKRIGPLHEVSAGSWTFVTDESEEEQDDLPDPVGIGALFVYTTNGGYWVNGMPSSIWSLDYGSVDSVDETYSFRIK